MSITNYVKTGEFPLPVFSDTGTLADFNGDGRADFAATVSDGSLQRIAIYLGADFSSQPSQTLVPTGLFARDVISHDIDSDGDIDLIAPDGYTGRVYVFSNDGRGG